MTLALASLVAGVLAPVIARRWGRRAGLRFAALAVVVGLVHDAVPQADLSVAAGLPALAVLPIGGKALFRYAEVVADARVDRPRLTRPDAGPGERPSREALVDYVIVGSSASWAQAIVLGVVVAT